MKRFMASVLWLSTMSAPVQASEEDLKEAFSVLSQVPADFFDFGSVCEHLARLKLYNKFPKESYFIESGIIYTNDAGTVLGELDVVVFHRARNQAVLIGEVKCWRNLAPAMKKAKEQLTRFATALSRNKIIRMYDADTHKTYYRQQFGAENMRSIYISQNGGEKFGFHMSIGLEHEEVQKVRSMLLKCQKAGQCPTARYRTF